MNVLIVKTSSLGDVLHTLPAVTDAARALPGIRFDWVVEEAYAEIPSWHPAVERVIPVALRRWRKAPWEAAGSGEWSRFKRLLRARRYDRVIDAQGLLKSALITRLARGVRCGLDHRSAWEPLATLAYQVRVAVRPEQHAITRMRQLFAATLGYAAPAGTPDYGIVLSSLLKKSPLPLSGGEGEGEGVKGISQQTVKADPAPQGGQPYVVFLHGTTWDSKHWPQDYWRALARIAAGAGYAVHLPWGNARERARAEAIAAACERAVVLPTMSLSEIAAELCSARGVCGVDSGLAHLAAALAVPAVTVYGATEAALTGTRGRQQVQLQAQFPCSPCQRTRCRYHGPSRVTPACYEQLTPDKVWQALVPLMRL